MSCAPILNKYQHPQRPMFEGSNFAPSKNNRRIPKTTITQCVLVGKEPNWQSTTTIRFAEVSLSGSPFNLTRVSPFRGYPFHLPFGTCGVSLSGSPFNLTRVSPFGGYPFHLPFGTCGAGSPFRGLPLFSLPIRIVLRGAFSPPPEYIPLRVFGCKMVPLRVFARSSGVFPSSWRPKPKRDFQSAFCAPCARDCGNSRAVLEHHGPNQTSQFFFGATFFSIAVFFFGKKTPK
jgi:hypothetical protein